MAKKKAAKGGKGTSSQGPSEEEFLKELTEEERRLMDLMEGLSKLLDDVYQEGMSLYDVVTVQRFLNGFFMDFIEEMHENEVMELVEEVMELSCPPAGEKSPSQAKPSKRAKEPAQ